MEEHLIKSKTVWWKGLKKLQNSNKNEIGMESTIEKQDTLEFAVAKNEVTKDLSVFKFTEKEHTISP